LPAGAVEVFVDYDGTITDRDTFDALVRRAVGAGFWNELGVRLASGKMTVRQALHEEAALIRGSLDDADAFLARETQIDPTFASFARRCARAGIPLAILSSGIEPLIGRALARAGMSHVPLRANGVHPLESGWKMIFRDDSDNGHDKARDVRAAAARGAHTIFIGDGHSDFEAATIADRRFAKAGRSLGAHLRAQGVAFTEFDRFAQIETALFGGP